MIDKEFEAFRKMMTSQFARLVEQAGYYIGPMVNTDREWVLAEALQMAWLHAGEFWPAKQTLVEYWDLCLRAVIGKQRIWCIRRFDRTEIVTSDYILSPWRLMGFI